jgi:hypothetical protein
MNYKDLNLKMKQVYKIFEWEGKKISVLSYLPIEDKYDIVMITLQKSLEDGIYNPVKLDMYFHLNLVYMFTDIEFTAEDREDESKLYDELQSTGLLEAVLGRIDPMIYAELQDDIDSIIDSYMTYRISAASMFKSFIEDLPANAEAAQKIVDNFNPEKYSAVVDFAKAANGGREIK